MSKQSGNRKPKKPYPEFPLFAHASGQWAKKIRGKIRYFGKWQDWEAALNLYLDQRDDLYAGRIPRTRRVERVPTVADLLDQFLTDKQRLVDCGELAPRTWQGYSTSGERAVAAFGRDRLLTDIRPTDFAKLRDSFPTTWGVTTFGNEITRIRVIFNYAGPNSLAPVDTPIVFGPMFRKPSKKAMRIDRASKPKRLFDANTIRIKIDSASPTLRAMIYLAINAALGNRDVGLLTPK